MEQFTPAKGTPERVVEQYGDMLYRLCLVTLGSRADAEDVVQDVFFNIWKNRHRISTDDPLYKYLLKAVYNRAINYIWKHKRDTEYRSWYGSQIDRMVFDYYDPDKNPILAKIYDNDMRQQLRQAVDELPDKRREIFRMRFFENMSNKEIGERLGLTVSTVENHMYLALKNLRDKLL